MKWIAAILIGLMAGGAVADDDIVALFGGHGRVVKTSTGYRTSNAVILRTSDGYRATMRDGRIIYLRRDAAGWRSSVYGEQSRTGSRAYFDGVRR